MESEADQVPLTGVRAEFRTALAAEIEAARRAASSSAVALLNGRRIAQVASAFQYVFNVESVLQLPEDSPGELRMAGQIPVAATIVAITGLAVTISVERDLGDFVPRASLQTSMAYLLRRLIERIEDSADRSNPTGARLLDGSASGEPQTSGLSLANASLNQSQRNAIASAVGRDTTFIWGPPGTGKTATIGEIGNQLARLGRSVLMVSHTNSAVDQAIIHIADALGSNLKDGSVLRLGVPHDLRLQQRPRLLAQTHIDERSAELAVQRDELRKLQEQHESEVLSLQRTIALCEWAAEAAADLAQMKAEARALNQLEAEKQATIDRREQLSNDHNGLQAAVSEADSLLAQLEKMPDLEASIAIALRRRDDLHQRLGNASAERASAKALYELTTNTGALLRRWRGLPKPEEQEQILRKASAAESVAGDQFQEATASLTGLQEEMEAVLALQTAFINEHGESPEQLRNRSATLRAEIESHRKATASLQERVRLGHQALESKLRQAVEVLSEWGLTTISDGSVPTMLAEIEKVHVSAVDRAAQHDLSALHQQADALNAELRRIAVELERIADELRRVEEVVVGEALVLATTLTRAYLRDSVQKRRFDTVILDEASMAPIPALWIAAGLGDRSAVAVGDFRQLPPIKHSNHELSEKWLGQDIFELSGIKARYEKHDPPEHLVQLNIQYRMHPHISALPNALIYENTLRDGEGVRDDGPLDEWFNFEWGQDSPVLLVDTTSTNAWVTSVQGTARSSRLNFISATVCTDLAAQLLRPDRPPFQEGARPRVLLISPYRPHTRLLKILIDDQGLRSEVVAGTAHTFQGAEAPVAIFDFVVDEPHWRVGLFNPTFDETTKRLLNVALTRAQRRLMIVGDFDWIQRCTKPHSFVRQLVGFLRDRYPVVDATAILPKGLAARAAEAHISSTGGRDAPDAARLVVTQDRFFDLLAGDLDRAQAQVVLYSPFITSNRLGALQPHLQAAAERGVSVYVITKTRGERNQREQANYRTLENALLEWGAIVIHKYHMHEKLVFIDEDVLWSGSLNPLSFSDTQEIMERRVSDTVVKDYRRTLRLDDLLRVYDEREGQCPVCGNELVPAEGRDQPFYWRCVDDGCHTRSIDQPAPRQGRIVCANCGGEVQYGTWGETPSWRCVHNARHRQRVHRNHLMLPKMRQLVPRRDLSRLDKRFGIEVKETKPCNRCGETKPVSDFDRDPDKVDGRRGICKACRKSQREAAAGISESGSRSIGSDPHGFDGDDDGIAY